MCSIAQQLPYPAALALGTAWGIAIAIIIGLPALRLRGLNLAIITLGFQLLCVAWLFGLHRLNNGSGNAMVLVHRSFIGWDVVANKKALYQTLKPFKDLVASDIEHGGASDDES